MKIKSIDIQAIRIVSSTIKDGGLADLKSINREYSIREYGNTNILYVNILVECHKNGSVIRFDTESVFNIYVERDGNTSAPTSDNDYYWIADMGQCATAHACALFMQEVRGTVFSQILLDYTPHILLVNEAKLKTIEVFK